MLDSYRHKGLRKKLVEEIAAQGIMDKVVLAAIEKLPRHFFLDNAFIEHAYENKAFRIGAGQTISQPYTVAYQSEQLRLQKGMKVLEIGTGSGYQTCILLEMGAKVFSIERQKLLFDKAKVFLPEIGYNPKLFYGDGYKGLPAFAPFDRIIITCGAPEVPPMLAEQLATGGRMVVPVGDDAVQVMTIVEKKRNGELSTTELEKFRFVPMLGDKQRE